MVDSLNMAEPSSESLNCLGRSISIAMTKREMLSGLAGTGNNDQVYDRLAKVVNANCPDLSFTGDEMEGFFDACSSLIAPDQKVQLLELIDQEAVDEPVCDLICLDQSMLDQWDSLRRNALMDMGMSEDEAQEQIGNLNQLSEDEFGDLIDGLNPENIISNAVDSAFLDTPPGS